MALGGQVQLNSLTSYQQASMMMNAPVVLPHMHAMQSMQMPSTSGSVAAMAVPVAPQTPQQSSTAMPQLQEITNQVGSIKNAGKGAKNSNPSLRIKFVKKGKNEYQIDDKEN